MDTSFDKILILSASVGAGHIRAAQAIERALEQMEAAREVRNVDTLDYTNKVFRTFFNKTYVDMVGTAPEIHGWLYDQYDRPWKSDRLRLELEKLNTGRFVRMLKEYQPDMVICTHFLPAELISDLRARGVIECRQAVVVTDMDAHAMWLCRRCEHYFVALDETAEHLRALGIPAEHITVSGIPIDPRFALYREKRAMRQKHKLKVDVTTILLSAGGFGMGPVEELLRQLMNLRHEAQVLAICGKNEELKEKVEKLAEELPKDSPVSIKALGFTTDMDEFMAASDIVIGKPGGLTTAESLARGLAFVIVNPIPGQEERNSDHLLEEGVAIRANNLPVLAYKIDKLLDDPSRLASMQANARRLSRPRAAYDIVSKLYEIAAAEPACELPVTPFPSHPDRESMLRRLGRRRRKKE